MCIYIYVCIRICLYMSYLLYYMRLIFDFLSVYNNIVLFYIYIYVYIFLNVCKEGIKKKKENIHIYIYI